MTPEAFAKAADVPRETMARLMEMDRVLMDWSSRHNLVAKSTIKDRWHRHYLDSAQIVPLLTKGRVGSVADMGSGAGFPGLVAAAFLVEKNISVTLIESVQKKAAFLTEAGRAMGLTNLTVLPERIEKVGLKPRPQAVTARALARLEKLLDYGAEIGGEKTRYVFLKGQDVEGELTEAAKCWHMDVIRHPSRTSPEGVILEIGNLARVR